MSVKSRHLLLLFYRFSIPIYAFLPALQNPKNASEVKVRSSSSKPASHGFLDCLIRLVVAILYILNETKYCFYWGNTVPDVLMMGVGEMEEICLCASMENFIGELPRILN